MAIALQLSPYRRNAKMSLNASKVIMAAPSLKKELTMSDPAGCYTLAFPVAPCRGTRKAKGSYERNRFSPPIYRQYPLRFG